MPIRTDELVAVVGAGSWGSALAHRVAIKGYRCLLWARRQELADEIRETHKNPKYLRDYALDASIETTSDLEEAAKARVLIIAVPSKGIRQVAAKLGDYLQPDQILLSATKGIEPKTYLRMTEVLKEETCCLKVGAISGPNLALEVMEGHPTATVVASPYDEVVEVGMKILNHSNFRAYGSHDLIGVEMAGALKNVMAISSGILTGIGYGANTRGFLLSRGLAELMRLAEKMHADPITLSGLAGVGDLFVTCSSEQSRNFRVGMRIGSGESVRGILDSMHQVAEGVRTVQAAYELAKQFNLSLPIIETIYQIVYHEMSLSEASAQLLGRPMKFELNPERIVHD
jgi:glycerol-3-phosphate dehydrogenase (NAD(P)+)